MADGLIQAVSDGGPCPVSCRGADSSAAGEYGRNDAARYEGEGEGELRRLGILAVLAVLLIAAPAAQGRPHKRVCPPAAPGNASCDALVVTNGAGAALTSVTPSGYAPANLRGAYTITSTGSATQTIAIVDAHDDPNAESDVNVYRAQFGLGSCTTASGCFSKVDQKGGSNYPHPSRGWAEEISLDLDMASAICPNCKILLVEAKSPSLKNLGIAANYAAEHANVVSNSYGGPEFANESSYDHYYNHPGVAMTVSSGDNAYGVEYPAASPFVTAVGGTSLTPAVNLRGWSETAWSGAGSGCSSYETKPAWQADPGCPRRTVADVSADGDPNTGVAVYDSYRERREGAWLVFGGTSVAAPIIAAVYALAANEANLNYGSFPYGHLGSIFDVTSGSNGVCGSYLCTAEAGYDGPTGLGTPNGTGGF